MAKINKIFAVGDSYMISPELKNAEDCWVSLLGRKLNAEIVNDSISSASNYRNVFQIVKSLKEDYDYYIILWNPYSRYTFYKNDNNHEVNFNIHMRDSTYGHEKFFKEFASSLYKNWFNNLFGFKILLQQIILTQSLLREHNKQYCMIHGPEQHLSQWLAPRDEFIAKTKDLINFDMMNDKQILDEYEEIQYYISLIDTSKFYGWNTFWMTQLIDKFPTGQNLHLLEEGNQYLANVIYNYVQNQISNS